MLDVHGAAVSGPTLPATAWRRRVTELRVHGAAVTGAVRALDRAPRLPRHGVGGAVVVVPIPAVVDNVVVGVVIVVVVPSVVGVVVGIVGVVTGVVTEVAVWPAVVVGVLRVVV